MIRQRDIIDRNFQEKLYLENRKQWNQSATDSPKVRKEFKKYKKTKERYFTKDCQIMELLINLKIEYKFIGTHQTEWCPKP